MTDFSTHAADDLDLLLRYSQDVNGQEAAFRLLVHRYSGLLTGTAMRICRRPDLAEDATQNVLLAMGLKAAELAKKRVPCLGAWLHRAAVMESKRLLRDTLRAERRHDLIQETMATFSAPNPPPDPQAEVSEAMLCQLDAAIDALGPQDREILLLHYFERLKFKEIAARLNIGADAAQKRSVRALEKLSALLKSSSAPASAAVLVAAFTPTTSKAAEADLAAKITTTMQALHCGKASIPTAVAKLIVMTNTTKISLGFGLAILGILSVSVSAGFLIGEKFHKPPSRKSLASLANRSPQPTVKPNTAVSQPAAAPLGDDSPAGKFVTQATRLVQAIRLTKAEIAANSKTGGDIEPFMRNCEALNAQGEAAAVGMSGDDFLKAKDLMAKSKQKRISMALSWLYLAWLKQDKAAAVAELANPDAVGRDHLFESWAILDFQEARQQALEASKNNLGDRLSYIEGVFLGGLRADPAKAVAFLQSTEGDEQIHLLNQLGNIFYSPSKFPTFLKAVEAVQDQSLRLEIIEKFTSVWVGLQPDKAEAWIASLSTETAETKAALQTKFAQEAALAKARFNTKATK